MPEKRKDKKKMAKTVTIAIPDEIESVIREITEKIDEALFEKVNSKDELFDYTCACIFYTNIQDFLNKALALFYQETGEKLSGPDPNELHKAIGRAIDQADPERRMGVEAPGFKWVRKGEKGGGVEPSVLEGKEEAMSDWDVARGF